MLILERARALMPVFYTFCFACSPLPPVLGSAHLVVQIGCFTHVHSYRKTSGKLFVLSS